VKGAAFDARKQISPEPKRLKEPAGGPSFVRVNRRYEERTFGFAPSKKMLRVNLCAIHEEQGRATSRFNVVLFSFLREGWGLCRSPCTRRT
jgi:hypothetical protein